MKTLLPSWFRPAFHPVRVGVMLAVVLALPVLGADGPASTAPLQSGARLDELAVGATVYHDVEIMSVSARSVMFRYRGGMASALLRELSPDLQARFGYDPQAAAASDAALTRAIADREAQQAVAAEARQAAQAERAKSTFDQVMQTFGQPATLLTDGVDLRSRFRELGLYAKDQGRRPSCAVFAVVSAIEYLNAENTGESEKFSEEYLIWATQRSLQRPAGAAELTGDDADTGFALSEVITALRAYGIPLAGSLPDTRGHGLGSVTEPPPEVIREARTRTQSSVEFVPGRDNATRLNNIVIALDAGLPVPIGTGWPEFHNMRAALLNTQVPAYHHAVTLVGYTCPSGRLEDTTFIFKNSWGPAWGANGYGYVTYAYLVKYLEVAILLEINFRE
ncbi:MAG: C1 family peptidase [Opitutales bacterium]